MTISILNDLFEKPRDSFIFLVILHVVRVGVGWGQVELVLTLKARDSEALFQSICKF